MNNLQLNEKAFDILKKVFGFSNYRYGQQEIVENIISGKKCALGSIGVCN